MNRRDFFRTILGALAALPIARLFGWHGPSTVDAAEKWLTDEEDDYIEIDSMPIEPVAHWTIVDAPAGLRVVGVDCASIDDDCTAITVYGSDGRRAVTYDQGATWTELDTN